jgi:hypothetical protein
MGWAFSSSRRGPGGGESLESACEARLAREAAPPLRPAMRASSEVNSCAVPFWCAAFPPLRAISRCFCGSIEENPRLPGTINSFYLERPGFGPGAATQCATLPASSQAATACCLRATPVPQVGFAPPLGTVRAVAAHRPTAAQTYPPTARLSFVIHGSNLRPIDNRILKSKPRFCRCSSLHRFTLLASR